ncbi:hypothetical protein ACJX0J_018891 [Zea mays]
MSSKDLIPNSKLGYTIFLLSSQCHSLTQSHQNYMLECEGDWVDLSLNEVPLFGRKYTPVLWSGKTYFQIRFCFEAFWSKLEGFQDVILTSHDDKAVLFT